MIQVMQKYLFKNIQVVNEGKIQALDVLTNGERIEKIAPEIENRINQLSINIVEDLAMDYVDFQTETDLINWLNSYS